MFCNKTQNCKQNKKSMSQHFGGRLSVLYKNRYCNQNEFEIIINHEVAKARILQTVLLT